MWKGRFAQDTDSLVRDFTNSVDSDRKFYLEDILGSQAHVTMLAKQGIISVQEAEEIKNGLDAIKEEIEKGEFHWNPDLEDIHMNIEQRLTELVGPVGQKLHTGRSRNDQVAVDFRLHVDNRLQDWRNLLLKFVQTLRNRAEDHKNTILPGYTHMQPAQPISLAQHLLAYAQMFKRDLERLQDSLKRVRISPLGAAALGGTTYPLDPEYTAGLIGFERVFENSMDAVADRDFVLEALFGAAVIMTHLSRLCEELIVWANPNFGFIGLPDSLSTGSSIMPQKKNPDVLELIRGRTGGIYGELTALFTLLKGTPLAYNRDLQEDKAGFYKADNTVSGSLQIMISMIAELDFYPKNMYRAIRCGYLNATELADYLASRGIPFREAHNITGRIVRHAEQKEMGLEDLPLEELQQFCEDIDADVYDILDYNRILERRITPGSTSVDSVNMQIDSLDGWIKEMLNYSKGSGGSV
ncbi:MAG: argininosuccinate lyase [Thermodesulfobacteriota bacterium]